MASNDIYFYMIEKKGKSFLRPSLILLFEDNIINHSKRSSQKMRTSSGFELFQIYHPVLVAPEIWSEDDLFQNPLSPGHSATTIEADCHRHYKQTRRVLIWCRARFSPSLLAFCGFVPFSCLLGFREYRNVKIIIIIICDGFCWIH